MPQKKRSLFLGVPTRIVYITFVLYHCLAQESSFVPSMLTLTRTFRQLPTRNARPSWLRMATTTTEPTKRKSRTSKPEELVAVAGSPSKLIIVESAMKAKTISKFLPTGWEVDFCQGHVREMPSKTSEVPEKEKRKWEVLGVKVHENFEPLWVILPDKKQIIKRLEDKTKTCEELYLATDEDREGEAISWHLRELLKPKVPVKRAVFHEITSSAVEAALENPREIDQNLVEAQKARRVLDRVAGYSMTPLLWKKIATRLSAGRVQSAGLALLVARERERMRFKIAEYRDMKAMLNNQGGQGYHAPLMSLNGKRLAAARDFDPLTGKLIEAKAGEVAYLTDEEMEEWKSRFVRPDTIWTVEDMKSTMMTRKRPAPFTTSTLQQEANMKLGLVTSRTMYLAQELYEGGYITYLRTDNPNLSFEGIECAVNQANRAYGHDVVASLASNKERKNAAKASAQEAHEAIRPAIVNGEFVHPNVVNIEPGPKHDLYEMIYYRTLAAVMKDAKVEQKVATIQATFPNSKDQAAFHISGRGIVSAGFLRAYSDDEEEDNASGKGLDLKFSKGENLLCNDVQVLQHVTAPPQRYSQGSFVKELERLGIGRPSTYSSIIDTLKSRGYYSMKKNSMVPSIIGFVVTQLLERYFPDFVDSHFTSKMEDDLDRIAKGKAYTAEYLREYYDNIVKEIHMVESEIQKQQAKRVVLDGLKDCRVGVFVGPFGPYVRDLLPGEPSDEDLLVDRKAGDDFYRSLADDDTVWSDPSIRRASLNSEMASDPMIITAERLEDLLEMQNEGMKVGEDVEKGITVRARSTRIGWILKRSQGNDTVETTFSKSWNISSLDMPKALALFEMPKFLGIHPETGKEIYLHGGYYPSIKMDNWSFTLMGTDLDDLLALDLQKALEVMAASIDRASLDLGEWEGSGIWFVQKRVRMGAHIRWNKLKVYPPVKGQWDEKFPTREEAIELMTAKFKKPKSSSSSRTKKAKVSSSKSSEESSVEAGSSKRKVKVVEENKKRKTTAKKKTVKEKSTASTKKKVGSKNPFIIFCSETRPLLPPDVTSFGDKQKRLSSMWKELNEEQREAYRARSVALAATDGSA